MATADNGKISEDAIMEAITQIRNIADSYVEIQKNVTKATNDALESWVGDGRDAFEHQYNTLIRKIDDFGETLEEAYKGLVDAAAAYVDTDTAIMQGYLEMQGK